MTTKDTIEVNYAGTRLYGPLYGVTDTDDMNHVSATAQAACDPLRGGLQSNCTAAADQITNPFKGVAPFAGSSYYTATTIGKLQFSRPYPQFLAITEAGLQNGKSWYNGLEAVYTHRTSWGLTANVGYTKSKFIVNTGFADVVNRIPSRVLSGTDVPNRLTALIVYKLPIARGSGFFPNMPRVLDLVVGGWQTADSYRVQSGIPAGYDEWLDRQPDSQRGQSSAEDEVLGRQLESLVSHPPGRGFRQLYPAPQTLRGHRGSSIRRLRLDQPVGAARDCRLVHDAKLHFHQHHVPGESQCRVHRRP